MPKSTRNIFLAATLLVLGTVAFAAPTFAANELTHNTSFEVGRWGYDAIPAEYVRNWGTFSQPVVTDETAAQGTHSLHLSNPSGTAFLTVAFPPMTFKKETPLTVSFYAKSDVPEVLMQVVIRCGFAQVISKTIRLKLGWQRYSFQGVVAKNIYGDYAIKGAAKESSGKKGKYALFFFLNSLKNKPVFKNVWLDAVQVEKGPLTEYAPAKSFEAALDMQGFAKKQLLIYDEGETDTVRLSVYSKNGAGDFSGSYTVTDELNKQVIAKGKLTGILSTTGHGSFDFPLPKSPRGIYRIRARIASDKLTTTAERVYGVIRDLRQRRKKGRVFFGGSILPFEMARRYRMYNPDQSYRLACYRRSPASIIELAARMGWQWIHFYDTVSARMNAKTAEDRDWTDSDFVVDLAIKNGLDVMSLLTSHGATKRLPAWMKTDKKSLGGNSSGKGAPIPDAAAYETFCADAAKHYQGRITWWENWNEPGVKMRVKEYMPLLKAGWRGIKRGNPNAKLLGLTGTWDRSGDLYGWVKQCLKLGAANYMDAIAIHGYHVGNRKYGEVVRKIAKDITGKEIPVWDTESGLQNSDPYGFGTVFFDNYTARDIYTQASRVTQHLANELASGLGRQSWFNLVTIYMSIAQYGRSMVAFDGAPNGDLIAHNAIIDLLVEAKFSKEIPIEGDTVAYLFADAAGPLCIFWNPALDDTTMDIPLARKNLQLLDVFARPAKMTGVGTNTTVPLDSNTRYLRGRGITLEEMATALQKATVKGLTPIRLISPKLTVHNNQSLLTGTFRNTRKRPLNIRLRTIRKPKWLKFTPPATLSFDAYGKHGFSWPLSFTSSGDSSGLEIVTETDTKSVLFTLPSHIFEAVRAGSKISVDGKAKESVWAQATGFSLAPWGTVKGCWDDNGLYFFAKVKDDEIVNFRERKNSPAWQTDGLELFFDWDREGDIDQPVYNADDTQLIFSVKGGKGTRDEVHVGVKRFAGNGRFKVKSVQLVSRKTATGYVMEISIPWSCLKSLGQKRHSLIGFSMAGRDIDAKGNEKQHPIWQGGNANYKDTTNFGLLWLKGFDAK